jgi:hypothetical protein
MLAVKQEMFEGKLRTITLDPTGKYSSIPVDRLVDVCGVLLAWAWDAVVAEDPSQTMQDFYVYGCHEIKGCKVDAHGNYKYPGDPLMHPVASVAYENAAVYVYEYAIVAVVVNGVSFVTRMN